MFGPLWNVFEAFLSVMVGLERFGGKVIGWRKVFRAGEGCGASGGSQNWSWWSCLPRLAAVHVRVH